MCSLLGASSAASLTFTHSPSPTSRPFKTGLLIFPFLVGSLCREDGCPIHDVGDDEEEDGFPLTTGGNDGGGVMGMTKRKMDPRQLPAGMTERSRWMPDEKCRA